MLGDDRWTDEHGTSHIIRPSTSPQLTMCRQLVEGEPAQPRIGCPACLLTTAVELENKRLEESRARLVRERKGTRDEETTPRATSS
ncbi:hypothetical protein [Saccharopolyspora phatthalungensis]|uniref:Uncharacterized protein n=1 Tax=Saccharopolyspora phatthalungensis TaxID=664693 RepID=A0A840Q624_9PSEU|nr:hypothetical protein [Saccharopolyspora phatthalungensis]MBB5157962.1 hypothetical protein [Saccharopolyspora phatthalungensis]